MWISNEWFLLNVFPLEFFETWENQFYVHCNDSCEKCVRRCLKTTNISENHIFFEYVLVRGGAVRGIKQLKLTYWNLYHIFSITWDYLLAPNSAASDQKYPKKLHDFPRFSWVSDNFGHIFHTNRYSPPNIISQVSKSREDMLFKK